MNDYEWEQYTKTIDTLGLGGGRKDNNGKLIKKTFTTTRWLILISSISFGLTAFFGMLSHVVLVSASFVASVFLVFTLMAVSIAFDILGIAVTAGNAKPLLLLASKGTRGAREALHLVMNADKVSCFCCDVVGDICSILSGAAGAAITLFVVENLSAVVEVLIAAFVSSSIAALTVLGKAAGKSYAINYSTEIMLRVGKMLRPFSKKKAK